MQTLRNWTQGQRASAAHLQESVTAIRELQRQAGVRRSVGQAPHVTASERFWGQVVTAGPDGSTYAQGQYSLDERHWVQVSYLQGSGVFDRVTFAPEGGNAAAVVYAHHVGDMLTHNHSLKAGQPVWVWAWFDNGDPQRKHYFCSVGSPGIFFVPVNLTTDGGANTTDPVGYATYTYKPIDPDSGLTLKLADGTTDAAHLSPVWQRVQGVLVGPATHGFCWRSATGTLVLLTTDEQPALVQCGTGGGTTAASAASSFLLMGA